MLTALLSDIHGNLEAFEACLRHARKAGAERLVLLGDFVGYGADPAAVVSQVRHLQSIGAVVVRGNHDDAVVHDGHYMNELAAEAMEWTRRQLCQADRDYLAQLPLVAREEGVCFVHSTAAAPERWGYVDSPTAAHSCAQAGGSSYTFCGHVHRQALYFQTPQGHMSHFQPTGGSAIPVSRHRRWVAVVGSVGQPRDRRPSAAYTMFDPARCLLTFHRVAYDHFTAAEKIRLAGLSPLLALRVERGM